MKKMKKLLSLVIVLCIMASCLVFANVTSSADNFVGATVSATPSTADLVDGGTITLKVSAPASFTFQGFPVWYTGNTFYIDGTSIGSGNDGVNEATKTINVRDYSVGTHTARCTVTYSWAGGSLGERGDASCTFTITCSHSYALQSDTATCTAAGTKTYICSYCNDTKTESSAALGHSPNDGSTIYYPGVGYNWNGYNDESAGGCGVAYTYCTRCGTWLTQICRNCSANFLSTEGTRTVAPTCTANGYSQKYCTACNATISTYNYTDATGHTPGDWAIATPASCTVNGLREKRCTECNAVVESEAITAPGHTPVTDAAVAPTCTETGLTQGSHCSVCNTVLTAQETVPIDSTNHNYTTDSTDSSHIASAATCTAAATYYYSCTRCGANDTSRTFTSGSVDSTNHNYTTDSTDVSHLVSVANCTTPATYYYSCTRCGANDTSRTFTSGSVDSTNHDYSSETKTSDYLRTAATCTADATYYYKCSRCSASSQGDTDTFYTDTGSAAHTPGTKVGTTATCIEAGTATYVCSVCGLEFTQAEAALGHDWGEWEVTSPATCSATGTKTRTCQNDSNHTETDTIAIDPDAHNIDGVDWTVTVAPTTSSTGTKVKYCTLCGAVVETEEIPVLTDPTAIDVLPNSSTVEVGSTTQLTLSTTPSDATTSGIVWTSSDPTVATVSSTGLVTGVTTGAVMITATLSSDNTVTDSVSVTVVPAQSGDVIDVVNTNPDIDVNVGADTTSVTVTGTSCETSSDGSNTFNFNIGLSLSSTYINTVVEENEVVAVITLDNNFAAPNSYRGVSGSTVYPAVADSVYIPLSAGSNVFSIVSPSYIQPDENGKVMWHVAVYLGGTVKAPKNELLYNSIVEFENDESGEATLAVSVIGDPLVSQSATTKNINISYANISSLSVAVEHQNPATGTYTTMSALASPVTLTSSGQNYAITINGASAMTPGTTIRLTFTGYDSSGNPVATDKCYLVASWIN